MSDMNLLVKWLRDAQEMRSVGQNALMAITRGIVPTTLGGPVDLANLGVNAAKAAYGYAGHKTGLLSADQMPQIDERPVGGSEWIADKMQQRGLLGSYRNPLAETIAGGLLAPLGGAAVANRAPQIARGLLQMGENAAAPSTMANQGQRGMALFKTDGMPERGRELIQSKAQALASQLEGNGFKVDLQHSGSAAGPSSYLKVFDPETGRYFPEDIRFSGHSKGAFNSQGVTNVASDEELASVLSRAIAMRGAGKSSGMVFQDALNKAAQELIDSGVKPKTAYAKARQALIER